jgi:hypothetical protein
VIILVIDSSSNEYSIQVLPEDLKTSGRLNIQRMPTCDSSFSLNVLQHFNFNTTPKLRARTVPSVDLFEPFALDVTSCAAPAGTVARCSIR